MERSALGALQDLSQHDHRSGVKLQGEDMQAVVTDQLRQAVICRGTFIVIQLLGAYLGTDNSANFSHPCSRSCLTGVYRAIGAVAVTVPTCYWLYSNKPDTSAHHDDHHESHDEEEESKDDEEQPAETEEKSDESGDDKSEESSSDEGNDTPDTSDDESEDKEKVTKSSEDSDNNETRKHVPDAKGGSKKRIESGNSITQGKEEDTADSDVADKVLIHDICDMSYC